MCGSRFTIATTGRGAYTSQDGWGIATCFQAIPRPHNYEGRPTATYFRKPPTHNVFQAPATSHLEQETLECWSWDCTFIPRGWG